MRVSLHRMTRVLTTSVPYGDPGVDQSVQLMASYVDTSLDTPEVIYFARQLAVRAGVRQQYTQALAIKNFLARTWRFVDDPNDRDLFVEPAEAIRQYSALGLMMGDCDEAATLGAALGRAVGMSAQFVVYSFDNIDPPGQHIFAVLLTNDNRAVSLDITRPPGPVPVPTRTMVVDV